MSPSLRRVATAAALAAAAVALAASPARAVPVSTGSFTAVSDPGDPAGGGGSVSYATGPAASLDVVSDAGERGPAATIVQVTVAGGEAGNDVWQVVLSAPAGQFLVPGQYAGAVRAGFNGILPGLSVDRSHPGTSCFPLSGSFTVTQAVYGTGGYVQAFRADFEQRCEGATGVLRGEVSVQNPPQPPPLSLGLTVRRIGTVDAATGDVTVSGTLRCTQAVTVRLSTAVTQEVGTGTAAAQGSRDVACTPGRARPWAVTAPAGNTAIPFRTGAARLTATATAYDLVTSTPVQVDRTSTVVLRRR